MTHSAFRPALPLAEVSTGRMRSCKLDGRDIVLCHSKDGVFAVDNVCTHAYARLSEGFFKGNRITCPFHGATFDVRDGRVTGGPTSAPLIAYPTRVVNGIIEVALPTAESAHNPASLLRSEPSKD